MPLFVIPPVSIVGIFTLGILLIKLIMEFIAFAIVLIMLIIVFFIPISTEPNLAFTLSPKSDKYCCTLLRASLIGAVIFLTRSQNIF